MHGVVRGIDDARDPPDVRAIAHRPPQLHTGVLEEGVLRREHLMRLGVERRDPEWIVAIDAMGHAQETTAIRCAGVIQGDECH
jgi:hypothetical protein